jgi:uncharacterized membrane protein YtjA (UPF0391 family)
VLIGRPKMGAKATNIYWTLGDCDGVLIFAAQDPQPLASNYTEWIGHPPHQASRATLNRSHVEQELSMLRYAIICLVIALVASALGMWSLSGTAMEAARILFFVFLVLFVVSVLRGRRGTGTGL